MNKELILIVDDIPGNLKLLGRILKKKNYSISIADNAKKALKFIDKRKPDLILLDIMMPEMNGFELCTNLKNNKNKKDIPIIFISALDDTKSKVKGFELGGVDYITKPFIKQEVLVRIKTHLNMSKAKKKIDLLYSNLDKKIKNAKRLHSQFLPNKLPKIENINISSYYNFADEIGGDFYQFIELNDKIFFYLSDVVGHGLDGSLLNVFTGVHINNFLMNNQLKEAELDLSKLLNYLNEKFIKEDFPSYYYICLFVGYINKKDKSIALSNAGIHTQPIKISKNNKVEKINLKGRPIGILNQKFKYKQEIIYLEESDKLFLGSDGLFELQNNKSDFFYKVFYDFLKFNSSLSHIALNNKIIKYYKRFIENSRPNDDITYVLIEKSSKFKKIDCKKIESWEKTIKYIEKKFNLIKVKNNIKDIYKTNDFLKYYINGYESSKKNIINIGFSTSNFNYKKYINDLEKVFINETIDYINFNDHQLENEDIFNKNIMKNGIIRIEVSKVR
ncbi:MAG: response regulator [Bacillota bacterium]